MRGFIPILDRNGKTIATIELPPVVVDELPVAGKRVGELVFDLSTKTLYTWSGSEWVAAKGGGGSAIITVAASDSLKKDLADYVCDGTDDQEEINNAIASLPDTGGMVVLLEGTYNISASIKILKSNVTLIGCGWATKLFLVNGANCNVIEVGDGATALENVTIARLQIDGNKANQSATSHGIHVYASFRVRINRVLVIECYIHDCYTDGVKFEYSYYGLVVSSVFADDAERGVEFVYAERNAVVGCIFINCVGVGFQYGHHTVVAGNFVIGGSGLVITNAETYGVAIVGNVVYQAIFGAQLGVTKRSAFVGNVIYDPTYDGVYMGSYSVENVVVGNTIFSPGQYGVYIASSTATNNLIAFNKIISPGSAAIYDAGSGNIYLDEYAEDTPIITSAQEVAADATGTPNFPHSTVVLNDNQDDHLVSAEVIIDYEWAPTAQGSIELYDETAAAVLGASSSKAGGEVSEWESFTISTLPTPGNTMKLRANITTAGAAGEVVRIHRAILRLLYSRQLNMIT